jgi:hypothetical protein
MADPMHCRACRAVIKPDRKVLARLGGRRAVRSRDDCVYHCRECGACYTNAGDERDREMITPRAELNVPREVRSGLTETLSRTPNRRKRSSKQLKSCFESSKDAVTWTVFRGLERQGRLDALVVPDEPAGEPALLFWGVPVCGERADEVAEALAEECRSVGERANAMSEPDVIVCWDDMLALVVARYRTGNEQRPNNAGFSRYLDHAYLFSVLTSKVASAGYYELTRGWRIGSGLAQRLGIGSFLLVNLGPPEKIEQDAEAFSRMLAVSGKRDFVQRSWNDVLEAARPLEPWLDRYASERHRLLYWR